MDEVGNLFGGEEKLFWYAICLWLSLVIFEVKEKFHFFQFYSVCKKGQKARGCGGQFPTLFS